MTNRKTLSKRLCEIIVNAEAWKLNLSDFQLGALMGVQQLLGWQEGRGMEPLQAILTEEQREKLDRLKGAEKMTGKIYRVDEFEEGFEAVEVQEVYISTATEVVPHSGVWHDEPSGGYFVYGAEDEADAIAMVKRAREEAGNVESVG